MLFHGARTDLQLAGNFLVAAPLHQQLENFRIPYSDFDFSNVSHMNLGIAPDFGRIARCIFKKSNCFAKSSPPPEKGTRPFECSSLATGGISLPDLAAS